MQIARNLKEFQEKNDTDLRKIIQYWARKSKATSGESRSTVEDFKEDLLNHLYVMLETKKVFDHFKYDASEDQEAVAKMFSVYIWKTVNREIGSFLKSKTHTWCVKTVTTVQPEEGGEVDVLDILNTECPASNGLAVHALYGADHAMEDKFAYDLLDVFDDFEKELGGSSALSEATRGRCLRYIAHTRMGGKANVFAKEEQVSSAYITYLKDLLSKKFRTFCESYDTGLI